MTLPTATDRRLGGGKWIMGPAGVALAIQGPWVYGALINNQSSVGGWGEEKGQLHAVAARRGKEDRAPSHNLAGY